MIDRRRVQDLGTQLWRQARAEAVAPCETAARAKFITAAAMLAAMSLYVLLWDASFDMQLVLLVAAGAVMLGRSATPLLAVVGGAWGMTLVLERATLFANDGLLFADFLASAALLAYVLFALRRIELNGRPLTQPRARWWFSPSPPSKLRRPTVQLRPALGSGLRLALAPTVAFLLLWLTPWKNDMENDLRLVPSAYRTMMFFWGLALAAFVPAAVFSLLEWRRLSPSQAAMYARWVWRQESFREQQAIERARAKRLRDER
jgi:hypothetical protein